MKNGIEIGGPSDTPVIYASANIIDNTIWCNQSNNYNYYPNKSGK